MKQVVFYTATGRKGSAVHLSEALFTQEANPQLLAQAVRVYQWNEHPRRGKTKTRAEVSYSTAKLWRQKGTGRARHGARSAPIFVHGGIAHGPAGVRRRLELSKQQVSAALATALSARFADNKIFFIDVARVVPKTRIVKELFTKIGLHGSVLVLHGNEEQFIRAARNIAGVHLIGAREANAYEILRYNVVVLTRIGLNLLTKKFESKKKGIQ